jgi:hypothetical protein
MATAFTAAYFAMGMVAGISARELWHYLGEVNRDLRRRRRPWL